MNPSVPPEPNRALLYIRQSESRPGEDAKTSLSLRSQEERGRQWCAERGVTVVGVVADHDLRGADPARPGIRQLLDDAERYKATTVWVLSLSRFARDHILQELVWRDLQARGVQQLVSDVESGTDDPFIRGIYGLMHSKAKAESSAHLRNAFARRARDGGFPTGPTPMGFRRPHAITIHRANGTSYERQTGEPVIEPEGAQLVRSLFERFDSGESLHAIVDTLAAAGPGPRGGEWARSSLRALLQAPIYVGDISHLGHVVAHNDVWQIVPRELFDRVQAKLSRLTVIRRGEWDSWLEGLVLHSCGQRMYYQRYTGRSRGHGGMFVCRGLGKARVHRCMDERRIIGGALLETAVMAALTADFAGQRTGDEALVWAQERSGGRSALTSRARVDRALRDAQSRWQRNHERFSAGKLPSAVMDAEDALLAAAESAHAAAIVSLPSPPDPERTVKIAKHLDLMTVLLPEMTPAERRALLMDLGTVQVSVDGVRICYLPEIAPHLPSTLIPVPRGGKGLRFT